MERNKVALKMLEAMLGCAMIYRTKKDGSQQTATYEQTVQVAFAYADEFLRQIKVKK